jgi:RNA processing factor Prp31
MLRSLLENIKSTIESRFKTVHVSFYELSRFLRDYFSYRRLVILLKNTNSHKKEVVSFLEDLLAKNEREEVIASLFLALVDSDMKSEANKFAKIFQKNTNFKWLGTYSITYLLKEATK